MKQDVIKAIVEYVDAKIEYAFANIEVDADGYTSSCASERKAVEKALEKLNTTNER